MDINPSARTLISLYPGATVVDASAHIVFPGFVNAHFHGESVLLHHMTRRHPFSSWNGLPGLRGALARLTDPSSAGDVAALYRTAGFLHTRSGTTSVGEFPAAYAPAVLGQAVEQTGSSGLRSVFALQTWEHVEAFRVSASGTNTFSVSLGSAADLTVYSLENAARASVAAQMPLAVHLGEVRAEVESLRSRFKKGPLRILKDAGALAASAHLIHCNHIPGTDLELLRGGANPVTLCVRSALAKQTGYPLLRSLASADVVLCLGTDWGETDILGEIRVLRSLRRYVPGVRQYSPLELMRMATINGACALGIASHTGSLEVGKFADLVMMPLGDVRLPALGENPSAEEVAAVVTDYCDTGMISDVMAQGVFRRRSGEAVHGDAEGILRNFRWLQAQYIPTRKPEADGDGSSAVPLVPGAGGETSPLFAGGSVEEEAQPKGNVNTRPPGPASEETLQKFPVVTKKIGKIFGEDDV